MATREYADAGSCVVLCLTCIKLQLVMLLVPLVMAYGPGQPLADVWSPCDNAVQKVTELRIRAIAGQEFNFFRLAIRNDSR